VSVPNKINSGKFFCRFRSISLKDNLHVTRLNIQ